MLFFCKKRIFSRPRATAAPRSCARCSRLFRRWRAGFAAALLATLLLGAGCGTNPVTGESELALVSTEQEIGIGRQSYGPQRQAEGGDYVLEPALTRYVQDVGARLAAVSDRQLPYEFRIVNDSTPNAWALPGGKIAINRGLLVELETEAELAAVLAHEIVHAAARHGAQGMERGTLLQGALIATGVALGDAAYRDLAMSGAQLGAQMVHTKYGRDAEREADLYGMRYMARAGYDPAAAAHLQETFVRLAEGREANWLEGLFASHPPSRERVDNNRVEARRLGVANGVVGRERYQQAIARLKRNRPAYEAYDTAREAIAEDRRKAALELVEKALRIEPEESLFHGLRGDLLAAAGNKREARASYDRALELNPDYFKHYLSRGFVRRDLGDVAGARSDFSRSLDLLPTKEARYGLGRLAADRGDASEAVRQFRTVADTDTPVGRTAARDLAKLDLEDNPGNYIAAGVRLNARGYLDVVVENRAALAVERIRVAVLREAGAARRSVATYAVDGRLDPGQRRAFPTELGPLDAAAARHYAARVVRAVVAGQ
jgi:predicted Zn-dependent protease